MTQRTRTLRPGLALLPALALAACHVDDEPALEFRSAETPYGELDMSFYTHPDPAGDDDPVWQIHGPGVYSGSADSGVLLMMVDDNSIRDPQDNVLCSRNGNALVENIRQGANGPVLYTSIGRQVYAGAPGPDDKPLYTLHAKHVTEGMNGTALLWSDTHIHLEESSMRKLVIVSLLEGACGGDGL